MASRHVSRGDTGDSVTGVIGHTIVMFLLSRPRGGERRAGQPAGRSDTIGKYGQALSRGCIVVPVLNLSVSVDHGISSIYQNYNYL